MLIEKINCCISSINELSTLRTNAMSVNAFEGAVNRLTTVDTMTTDYVATVEEMNKHDFCEMNLSAEDVEKLRNAITTCAAAVNNMTLTNNDVDVVLTVFQSQKTLQTVFWKSKAKAYVEPIRSYLGVIQSFVANKDEVSGLIKALGTGSTTEPNAAIVRTLAANVKKANAITSNFQMSNSIRTFLQKVKNGNATYADITPAVSEWIIEHKLSSRIKISF